MTNKDFWKTVKPFLTNKGVLENNDIVLIEDGKIICDENILCEIFNEHYINIVEKSSGEKPSNIMENIDESKYDIAVDAILNSYKDHPSIIKIKSFFFQIRLLLFLKRFSRATSKNSLSQ